MKLDESIVWRPSEVVNPAQNLVLALYNEKIAYGADFTGKSEIYAVNNVKKCFDLLGFDTTQMRVGMVYAMSGIELSDKIKQPCAMGVHVYERTMSDREFISYSVVVWHTELGDGLIQINARKAKGAGTEYWFEGHVKDVWNKIDNQS